MAIRAIALIGCWMVETRGTRNSLTPVPSKEKSATSPGTESPRSASALMAPTACTSLETKTAEADWLEQGKEIDASKLRRRLPRPFIPDDTFQFWWFRDEYWIDELGYYEFTIKTECYDEVQQ